MTTAPSGTLYNHLLETIDLSLVRCRKSFSTEDAIRDCYGNDATMFESSDNSNFLVSAIDAMVDQVNGKVKAEMLDYLKEEQIEGRLGQVEGIINELNRHDKGQKEADEQDRHSARAALETARLPKGVQPADVLRHQTHELMMKERESLLAVLSEIEADVEEMNKRIEQSNGDVEEGKRRLHAVQKDLRGSTKILEEAKRIN